MKITAKFICREKNVCVKKNNVGAAEENKATRYDR